MVTWKKCSDTPNVQFYDFSGKDELGVQYDSSATAETGTGSPITWHLPSSWIRVSNIYEGDTPTYWPVPVQLTITTTATTLDGNLYVHKVSNQGTVNFDESAIKVCVLSQSSSGQYTVLVYINNSSVRYGSGSLRGQFNLHFGLGTGSSYVTLEFKESTQSYTNTYTATVGTQTYTYYETLYTIKTGSTLGYYAGPKYFAYDQLGEYVPSGSSSETCAWCKDTSTGLWYIARPSGGYIVTQSSSVGYTWTYQQLGINLYYNKYSSDSSYTKVTHISSLAIGSAFYIPSAGSQGTRTHYAFKNWQYEGTSYSSGSIAVSVPPSEYIEGEGNVEIDTVWDKNYYTISFTGLNGANPSSIDSITAQYNSAISLKTDVTKSNYDFKGWSDGSTTYTSTYTVTGNATLSAVFTAQIYKVWFYDAYCSTPFKQYNNVAYGTSVAVPSPYDGTIPSGYTFTGWKLKGTQSTILGKGATTFSPNSDYYFEAVYVYSLYWYNLKTEGSETYVGSTVNVKNISATTTLTSSLSVEAGYEFKGWGSGKQIPNPNNAYSGSYSFKPMYSFNSDGTHIVLTAIPTLYSKLTPKSLTSLTLENTKYSISENQGRAKINISVSPADWLGTPKLVWSKSQGTTESYISISELTRDKEDTSNFYLYITGKEDTSTDDITLTVQANSKTYDSSSTILSAIARVIVTEQISITFFTRTDDGVREIWGNYDVKYNEDEKVYQWVNFPTDTPVRTGYLFNGWVDADNDTVTADENVPTHKINIYATWTKYYEPIARDTMILQLYNADRTSLISQFDLGVIQSTSSQINTGVSAIPTATMTSSNTIITTSAVTETMRVEITRVSPTHGTTADDSDDSNAWTNRKWITELRKLVDRYQASTDGICLLMIPRGFKVHSVNGQYAGWGDNFPLLGYVKKSSGVGLLYEQDEVTYSLQGYTCYIISYSDTYSANNQSVINVEFTIQYGGMKSNYQSWSDSLVL